MLKILKRTIKGCGYVPGYGDHPGTKFLLVLIVMGGTCWFAKWWHHWDASGSGGYVSCHGANLLDGCIFPLYGVS